LSDQYDKEDVLKKWEVCKAAYSQPYQECKDDWEFLHGVNQWDSKIKRARELVGSPCLVLNQLLPYANQVVNDNRQANIAIRVSPVDEGADVETAEIFQGVIRGIERQSSAQNAYATAVLNAVGAGIGWFRARVEFASPMSFDQEIYIDRVLDFTSVYLDPTSTEIDGSDAEYGFILRDLSLEEFEALYPDAEVVSFGDTKKNDKETITVAEYYSRLYKDIKIYQIQLIDGSVQVVDQDQMDALEEAQGTPEEVLFAILDERTTQLPYIKHCILNGGDEPLEESDFPSEYIPLVPVIGNEVYINNKREFHSLIRQGKDAQKIYNYLESANVEYMALQPKTPWVGAVGSFSSSPAKWANANTDNFAFLEYDIVYDESGQRVEPPRRSEPPQGSMALMQSAQIARDNIRYAIGIPPANMGETGTEVSGIAIRNRQIEGDNATFHFSANLAASISQLGRIIVDMIPRVYNRPMIRRILGNDGVEKRVPINQPFVKNGNEVVPAKKGGDYDGIYDLGAGKYDVVCDIGASYSSKRQEMSDKLNSLIAVRPEIMDVVGDLVFQSLDLPMAKEISERIRSQMSPAMLGEDPMAIKLQEAQAALDDMQSKLEMYDAALQDKRKNQEFEETVKLKQLDLEYEKLKIDASKTMSDIQKTQADIEKMRAETTGFNIEAVTALGNAVNGIAAQMQDMGQVIEIMLDAKEAELNEVSGVPETPVSLMEDET
jgi:hypothetical protein